MLLNVLDYPSVQSAFDAAKHGDRICFPGGRPYEAPPQGWQITKSLEIFGDGPGNPALVSGTILTSSTIGPGTGKHNDVLVIISDGGLSHVYIHDLAIGRPAAPLPAPASRDGIRWYRDDYDPNLPPPVGTLGQLRLERVDVRDVDEVGIHLRGADGGPNAAAQLWMLHCNVEHCGKQGAFIQFATNVMATQCRFAFNGSDGCNGNRVAIAMYGCTFESNRTATVDNGLADLRVLGTPRLDACRFTNCTNGGDNVRACYIQDCEGAGYISGCVFTSCPRALVIENAVAGACMVILPNRFESISIAIDVTGALSDTAALGVVVLPQFTNPADVVVAPLPPGSGPPESVMIRLPLGADHSPASIPSTNNTSERIAAGLAIPRVPGLSSPHGEGNIVFEDGELKIYAVNMWRRVLLDS